MIPEILLLVEQIRPRTSQVDDLRTAVPILLQPCTLKTVESVRDPFPAADDALVLVVAKGAFIADTHEGGRAHVAVTNGTFAITLVTEASEGYAGLFAAHY